MRDYFAPRSRSHKGSGRRNRPWRSHSAEFRKRFDFVAVLVFLAVAFAFGGASRIDVLSQVVVRLAAVALIALTIVHLTRDGWRTIRVPLSCLLALAGLMIIQLIPLPPDIWTALPGREPFVNALRNGGLEPGNHSLSITPDLTWNSLLATLPGAAALLGLALTDRSKQGALVSAVLIGMALSAFVSVVQISTGGPYFYRITNSGSAVGLFANRNHQALLMTMAFPFLAVWASQKARTPQTAAVRTLIALFAGVALFPLLLVTGSRSGLMLGALSGAASFVLASRATSAGRAPNGARGRLKRWATIGAPLALGAVAILAFLLASRDEALQRMFQEDYSAVRVKYLPIYMRMVMDFLPFGSGFGSFDPVFRTYEPMRHLGPFYLNHAHNDLAEVLIEGGLVGAAILLVFLGWWLVKSFHTWRARSDGEHHLYARAGSLIVGLALLQSLVDYPLRTPSLGVMFAIGCWWLAQPRARRVALE